MTTAAFIMVFVVPPVAVFLVGWWAVRRQEAELAAAGGSVPGMIMPKKQAAREKQAASPASPTSPDDEAVYAAFVASARKMAERAQPERTASEMEQLLRNMGKLMRRRDDPASREDRGAAGQPSPSEDQRSDTLR